MFHAFDNDGTGRPIQRRDWMAWVARAPLPLLEQALALELAHPRTWLRRPETGLYMVQGRVGGTGQRFNVGEVTVTRCALRAGQAGDAIGVAYVLGRNHRHAELAALADALLQAPDRFAELDQRLLTPLQALLRQRRLAKAERSASTRVDFFTVARESGGMGGDDSDTTEDAE